MTDPLSAVAKVASNPGQAKVFVAMLQAEGIPAFVYGGALTDEFAMSQQLAGLQGVTIRVAEDRLDEAKAAVAAAREAGAKMNVDDADDA